jgi:hypothetical protein
VRLIAETVYDFTDDESPTAILPKSSEPPVSKIAGVVYPIGAKSTPRNTVFVGAVARVVAVLVEPASVTFIKVFGLATFVVAYITGLVPLQSTVKPRVGVLVVPLFNKVYARLHVPALRVHF